MKYKPDWEDAMIRLSALWNGQPTDRPCIAVIAPSDRAPAASLESAPAPATPEERWLAPECVVPQAVATISSQWWGGEAAPSFLLMAGWVVSIGGKPRFDHGTIWFEQQKPDFDRPPPFRHDPQDNFVRRFEKLYVALADAAGWDDFMVGSPCLLPANDLISMHMGPENFLVALMDEPEWMLDAITTGAAELIRARRHFRTLVEKRHRFWYGNAGWMPFWAPEPFAGLQSDVSCMISPELFDRFVVPEIELWSREIGAVWYHLDGGDARQHLPRLLSLACVRVIQYTPAPSEPPNGPAHMEFYRRIQEAGKIVHIQLDASNVEPLCRELDPSRLMLHVACRNPSEGRELLASARRWCSARAGRRPGAEKPCVCRTQTSG